MKFNNISKAILLSSLICTTAIATELEISVTNLTHGNHFTPLLITAHSGNSHLFQAGEMATPALQKMAEGGDISDLVATATANNEISHANPAQGLLAPGAKVDNIMIDTMTMTHLSIVAMVLPTNDAFIGLDAWEIPTTPGTYTININAYDAGTENNNEIINGGGMPGTAGIPAAPGGDGGSNAVGIDDMSSNDKVHIHPGVIGDTDPAAGPSDLDSRIHRWLNPVARVVVEVK